MQFLDSFYTRSGAHQYTVSAEQGSTFAKNIAGDFNPIHDAESKRFCVPGDLLFALALQEYGLHQRMDFQFLDLLGHFPTPETGIAMGDTEACLTGESDGMPFGGCDDIETVLPCGIGFELAFLLPPLLWMYGRRRRPNH